MAKYLKHAWMMIEMWSMVWSDDGAAAMVWSDDGAAAMVWSDDGAAAVVIPVSTIEGWMWLRNDQL